jgi:hypothetical protein
MKKTQAGRLPLLASIALLMVLAGACRSHTYRVIFQQVDRHQQMKPGSIAVIAGNDSGFDARLAQAIAEILSRGTVLTVVPADKIADALPGYPLPVMDQFDKRKEKRQNPRILSTGEHDRLDTIHARLNTDYVLAVWGTQLEKVRMVQVPTGFVQYIYRGNIHARLVVYPSGEVLGYTRYRAENMVDRQTANYAQKKGNGETIFLEQLIEIAADEIVTRLKRGYGENIAKK